MRSTILIALGVLIGEPGASVAFVGTYHDLRVTEDHAYGNILELWRDGDTLVGRWSRADGQPADFPTVSLESVTFAPGSGALAFTMKWCDRVERFDGLFLGDAVTGRLLDGRGRELANVYLKRDPDDLRAPLPRDEWERQWRETNERRRPRCN